MSYERAEQIMSALPQAQQEWLELVVHDWQLIADLAFADLLLWVPQVDPANGSEFILVPVRHVNPATAQSMFTTAPEREDFDRSVLHLIQASWVNKKSHRTFQRDQPNSGTQVEAVPVVRGENPMGVITMHLDLADNRLPSKLEMAYRQSATDLLLMATQGLWPNDTLSHFENRLKPRVGDGLIRLTHSGDVDYISPNAVTALRRIGHTESSLGKRLPEIFAEAKETQLPPVGIESHVLAGMIADGFDFEHGTTTLVIRAQPLWDEDKRLGAIILIRDVSELRRRELQLVSKDVTIKEIHHRVKNNLQTVAALLRMQARRLDSPEARKGMEEAMRRVETIAQVHQSLSQGLSQTVDFDELMTRQFRMAVEVATQNQKVRALKSGTFGHLNSAKATPLALVVTELAANAVEHGLKDRDGTVLLRARHFRTSKGMEIEIVVSDDGVGIGNDQEFEEGLGLQIVRTLVTGELRGSISWQQREGGGTEAVVTVPLPSKKV